MRERAKASPKRERAKASPKRERKASPVRERAKASPKREQKRGRSPAEKGKKRAKSPVASRRAESSVEPARERTRRRSPEKRDTRRPNHPDKPPLPEWENLADEGALPGGEGKRKYGDTIRSEYCRAPKSKTGLRNHQRLSWQRIAWQVWHAQRHDPNREWEACLKEAARIKHQREQDWTEEKAEAWAADHKGAKERDAKRSRREEKASSESDQESIEVPPRSSGKRRRRVRAASPSPVERIRTSRPAKASSSKRAPPGHGKRHQRDRAHEKALPAKARKKR